MPVVVLNTGGSRDIHWSKVVRLRHSDEQFLFIWRIQQVEQQISEVVLLLNVLSK